MKATISLASPVPALVDALTEILYGTYGSERQRKWHHFHHHTYKQFLLCIIILLHICKGDLARKIVTNLPMPLDILASSSLYCLSISNVVLLIKFTTATWYPVMTPLGERGGSQETLSKLSDTTNTCILLTTPGAIKKKNYMVILRMKQTLGNMTVYIQHNT